MSSRVTYVLIVTLTLGLFLFGCGAQESAPVEPPPTFTASKVEPEIVTPTANPEPEDSPNMEEEAQPPAAESEAQPDAGVAPQWDEGPITFKSDSLHGNMTASGEPFDKDSFTAAHKDLPFDTEVTVINLVNGKSTIVRINDRLPPQVSAVIDISPAAAREIEMVDAGIVDGRIEW